MCTAIPTIMRVRNHIIDFLVTRSKSFANDMRGKHDPRQVPVVRPTLVEPALAADSNVRRLAGQPAGH